MSERPTVESERLILRPFAMADTPRVHQLVSDRAIAATTLNIPHPYEPGMAEAWISSQAERYESGRQVNFAITLRADGSLIGGISLGRDPDHENAEMGYYVGKAYWNQGYGTEAAIVIIRFGFEVLKLNRIYATHFGRNPASGRIMQKAGMRYEGCWRQHIKKWGLFEDLEQYALLRTEYDARTSSTSVLIRVDRPEVDLVEPAAEQSTNPGDDEEQGPDKVQLDL